MIRVLLVPSSDYLGHPFPQRHNQIFERLNNSKGFEVHVIRFKLFEEPRLKTNLTVHELEDKPTSNLASYYLTNAVRHAAQIRKIARQESIDAIVLSNLTAPLVFTLTNELSSLHIPVVFDLPDFYPTSAAGFVFDVNGVLGKSLTGMLDFTLHFMLRRVDVVTAASHALANYAKRAGARSVVYITNGISECFLRLHDGKDLREKLGYGQEDLVVGYIGSMEFWLDMRQLLKGLALAEKKGLPVKLLIVGRKLQTDYSAKVAKWIKLEHLEKHTTWLDFVSHEQVPEYMSGLDAGTIPFDMSNPTALYAAPNKMWEYLSQLRPVLATPIPEVLGHSDCVLPVSTPEDYAQELLLIAKKDVQVNKKTETGYRRALSMTWEKSKQDFASTLHALLNKGD